MLPLFLRKYNFPGKLYAENYNFIGKLYNFAPCFS